jgi:hypothetical protein
MSHYVGTLVLDDYTFTSHGNTTQQAWNELSQELGRKWDDALDIVLDQPGPKRASDLIAVGDKYSAVDNVLLGHKWDDTGVLEAPGAVLTVEEEK